VTAGRHIGSDWASSRIETPHDRTPHHTNLVTTWRARVLFRGSVYLNINQSRHS